MTQTVFPCLTFRNAKASFEWLGSALGAEAVAVHEDDDGRVVHALGTYRGAANAG